MCDNAVRVCASRWRCLTAHGHRCSALSITFTDVIGNAGTLDARMFFIAQGTSVPISRGSSSV
jgi:hypothetical protein